MKPGPEAYRTTAENVVSQLREDLGVELKYDEPSIQWLDGYINRIRAEMDKESYRGLAAVLGAYVGEAIIATYGGAWAYFDDLNQWGGFVPEWYPVGCLGFDLLLAAHIIKRVRATAR